jgi:hypothetical protein
MSENKPCVQPGDRVQYWAPVTGLKPLTGTVVKAEIKYGTTYATITPDDSDEKVFLFHGAVYGFELIGQLPHPWSPQAMGRLKGSKGVECGK